MVRYFGISHRTSVYHFERYTDVRYDIPKYRYDNDIDIIHMKVRYTKTFDTITIRNSFILIFSIRYKMQHFRTVYHISPALKLPVRVPFISGDVSKF